MWLARSLPPLLSHLRPPASARRASLLLAGSPHRILSLSRVCTSAGANNLYRDPADGAPVAAGTWSASPPNRPHLCSCFGANQLVQRRRQNLYVVLDDWKNGFSLHKLTIDDMLAASGGMEQPQRLPEPILRLGFLMVGSCPHFHALGSNIVATSHSNSLSGGGGGFTLVYDTETAALHTEQSLPRELVGIYDAVAVGDKLYTFDSCSNTGTLLYCLRLQMRWTWNSSPAPPRPSPHFISACALHPDGRTIFVSFRDAYAKEKGTFSLDTESGEWTHRGDWCMPFRGQAHYDADIHAWVGTCTVDDAENVRCYEHLCSCDVPALGEGPTPAPTWKVEAERLTFLEPYVEFKFSSRVLLPMGCDGMFRLVEHALRPGVTFRRSMGDGDGCLLRVTMFRAKYGKNGELVAATLWHGRSYYMSRYVANFNMSAFWI